MGGYAWVTLATNDSYSLGALVLAHSLKQVGTEHQLVVLVTPGVTAPMRDKLASIFNLVQEVNILDSRDEANLRLLKRPELGVTFTKLHCWRLTQYDKCVFLDADTLVLQYCDELFDREELSAAPDVGWPDCFNSGVFVYRPSNDTYEKLIQFALDRGSFDGGDQGLLNLYFSDWAHKDISRHLPFIYNMCSTACYSYLPAFKQFAGDVKIIHFIGTSKPWLQYFDTETKQVEPSNELQHLKNVLQYWWDLFCKLIHPTLTSDMARSSSDVTHYNYQNTTNLIPTNPEPPPPDDYDQVWDPWEEYDNKIHSVPPPEPVQLTPIISIESQPAPSPQPEYNHEPSIVKPIESHNTNACSYEALPFKPHPDPPPAEPPMLPAVVPQHSYYDKPPLPPPHPPSPRPENNPPHYIPNKIESPVVVEPSPKHTETASPALPSECEATTPLPNDSTLHTHSHQDKSNDSGLAGAFAQLTLGAPRTAEQSALDDHLRRQGWEAGNIDYLGRDSFDNIWSKICETLASVQPSAPPPPQPLSHPQPRPQPEPQQAKPKEPTPPPTSGAVAPPEPAQAEAAPPQCETPKESVAPPAQDKPIEAIPAPTQESAPPAECPKPAPPAPQPASEPSKPAAEPPKPTVEPPKPAAEPPKPAAEPPKPTVEPPKPAVEPPKPAAEPPKPAAQPPKPVAVPPKPVAIPPKPIAEPPKAAPAVPKTPAETPKVAPEVPKAVPTAPKATTAKTVPEPPKSSPKSIPESPKTGKAPGKPSKTPPKTPPESPGVEQSSKSKLEKPKTEPVCPLPVDKASKPVPQIPSTVQVEASCPVGSSSKAKEEALAKSTDSKQSQTPKTQEPVVEQSTVKQTPDTSGGGGGGATATATAASAATPTPPPRKGSGGTKKTTKAKK